MIKLIATVESIQQGRDLLAAGVDCLYFGEDRFGLRLPYSFSREEQAKLTQLAHEAGKEVSIALNAIFHNEGIDQVPEYLEFVKEIGVDSVTLGDPGVIQKMKRHDLLIPYRYDAQVVVTNSKQINFWAKRGAIGAVLAREIPRDELKVLAREVTVPVETLVYGATCIHQSRRPLLENYFNYIAKKESVGRDRGLFLSEPLKKETHYSIYEDDNGTHIFANNDISMVEHLDELYQMGLRTWKLDGLFSHPDQFVEIASAFNQMRQAIEAGQWNQEKSAHYQSLVASLHPATRGLDTGFYEKDPKEIV
ncbi:peptidase U32 family protein [Ignavigranum ruoffiae]|uniref:peptidase U32 family protein n=1 Tax=Ignavigranum ruoffiae TaxID=89093 RepID=UPI003AFFFF7F